MCRAAEMAEDGAAPAGEDRRQVPSLDAQRTVAEGIDATVDHVQAAPTHPMVDGGRG